MFAKTRVGRGLFLSHHHCHFQVYTAPNEKPIPAVILQCHRRRRSRCRRVPPSPSRLPPVANAFVSCWHRHYPQSLWHTRYARLACNIIHMIIIDFVISYDFDFNILPVNNSFTNGLLAPSLSGSILIAIEMYRIYKTPTSSHTVFINFRLCILLIEIRQLW